MSSSSSVCKAQEPTQSLLKYQCRLLVLMSCLSPTTDPAEKWILLETFSIATHCETKPLWLLYSTESAIFIENTSLPFGWCPQTPKARPPFVGSGFARILISKYEAPDIGNGSRAVMICQPGCVASMTFPVTRSEVPWSVMMQFGRKNILRFKASASTSMFCWCSGGTTGTGASGVRCIACKYSIMIAKQAGLKSRKKRPCVSLGTL
mmetsp:Transcript_64623/g.185904  ORF Transcript_64623/g.185904 Transcript_64623/m.185904 type:complete len:207 (+) Transcript_64623:284-904(+)